VKQKPIKHVEHLHASGKMQSKHSDDEGESHDHSKQNMDTGAQLGK